MNPQVKRLALFISFSAACLGIPYSAIAADSAAVDNTQTQAARARPPRDLTPPVITLNGDAVMTVYQETAFIDPGATAIDAVDGPINVTVRGTPLTSRPGTYTVTYSAVDKTGNKATVQRKVIVLADTIAPVVTLNGDSTMSMIENGVFADPGATATDNLDAYPSLRVLGRVRRNIPGTYTLTYEATDNAGNTGRAIRTVTVIADTTAPVITLNGESSMAITRGSSFNDPGATATDNSAAPVTISAYGRVNTSRLGTYTLTYRARDRAGNISTATRTITVIAATPTDTVAPVITLNGAATIEVNVGGTYTELGATATDNVDGTVTVTTTGSVNTTTAGTYTITYTAKDAAGNTATATRTVTVKPLPNVAPTANAGMDQTVNEQTAVTLSGSATDSDGTIASYAWVQTAGSAVSLSNPNQAQASFTAPEVATDTTLSFKLTVTDNQGATAEDTVTVLVKAVDSTKPVISLNGAATLELTVGDTYTEAGATATDDVDGTVTVTTTGSVNTTTAGTYTITYTAKDAAGNTATATRTVTVKPLPNVAPTANAGMDQTVNEQTAVTLSGSATDSDGTIASYAWVQTAGSAVSSSNPNQAQASFTAPEVATATTLSFKLTVTDNQGATAEDTVTVLVKAVDSTKPVISLNGAATLELTVGDTYTEAGATATDDVDGTVTVTTTGSVNTTTTGTYTITYTATDAAGNTATATRTVTVIAVGNLPPTVVISEPSTIEAASDISLSAIDSNDADGSITSYAWTQTGGTPVTLEGANTHTIHAVAPSMAANDPPQILSFKVVVTDNAGATAEASTTVTVKYDNTAPNLMLYGSQEEAVVVGSSENFIEPGFNSWDNIDPEVNVTISGSVDMHTIGNYTLTYTATDDAGNSTTATRLVKVVAAPNMLPTAATGSPQTVTGNTTVILDGSSSTDSDGTITSYAWTQVSGSPVTLNDAGTSQASFLAPNSTEDQTLVFQLVVTDNQGTASDPKTTFVQIKGSSTTITPITLNDTGITLCASASSSTETCSSNHVNQDAQVGRDFTHNDDSDGHAGFSFTKLDSQGQALLDQTASYTTTPWSCVKDNVTGLTWEIKTDDDGLHDLDWTYSWYNPDSTKNGRNPGVESNGVCNTTSDTASCDTLKYVQTVNAENLCGANDWRLPSANEMISLFHYNYNQYTPAATDLDPNYFPYRLQSTYWTSTSTANLFGGVSNNAWTINFRSRTAYPYGDKSVNNRVMLVRGAKY